MDIFSHGLWAAVGAKGANLAQDKRHVSPWVTAWWGVFPDLFAFTIPFVWMIWGLTVGGLSLSDMPGHRGPPTEPAQGGQDWTLVLAGSLYNVSHSLIVFFFVFFMVWALLRRPVWELGGWLLHILSDIPTHSYQFFPTPIFWPFFDWKFDGFAWGTPWFLIPDYILLVSVFIFLWYWRRQKEKSI